MISSYFTWSLHMFMDFMMKYEVDNFMKFWSKHQMQRNSLNQIFKILRHQEHMILSSSMYERTYLQVSLKEFLKLFKCLASSGIHTISGWLDLLFKALHQERKSRKEIIPTRLAWAPSVVVILPLFIDIWYEGFSWKPSQLCLYPSTSIDLMCVTL